jgi:chitinase
MRRISLFSSFILHTSSLLFLVSCTIAPTQHPTTTVFTPTPPITETPTRSPAPTATRLPPSAASVARVLAGYYAGWSADRYPVSAIPADQLTHVFYAFANISPGGECVASNPAQDQANWAALQALKQAHPQLRLLLSVGGWTQSGLFSDVAATPEARTHFAQSCAALVQANGFDGLDVDWEFPVEGGLPANHTRPDDGLNFTALLTELRAALTAQSAGTGQHYLLTIAAPAGKAEYQHLELRLIAEQVDWINLMAYDFTIAASPTTNFNAPLFAAAGDPAPQAPERNADAAVQAYLAAGVPGRKLVLGAPFYGRAWQGVPADNDGLFQPDSGPAQGSFAADGIISYGDLETRLLPAGTRHVAPDAQVPWLYDAGAKTFVTYEDPDSLGRKADYAVSQNLGGMMFWELSMDDAAHSLLGALHSHLGK